MLLSKIALTCALMIAGQAAGDHVYTNLRSGKFPPVISPERLSEIRELQLYMSSDQGKTWSQVDKMTPEKEAFTYQTPADGEYWYHVVVINKYGKQEPADLYKTPPMMKLVVDTRPPDIKITSAQRQGDELVVHWAVREDNPDPQKLKLAYRTSDSASWTAIPLTPNAEGTARIRLGTKAPLVVQMAFADRASNAAKAEVQVAGEVAVAAYNATAATSKTQEPLLELPGAPMVEKTVATPPPPQRSTPTIEPHTVATAPAPPAAVATAVPVPAPTPTPAPVAIAVPATPLVSTTPQSVSSKAMAIASSTNTDATQGSPIPIQAQASTPPRIMPELQIVSEPEIVLEYEVSKVGPAGLGKVEVWITRDNGTSWTRFAEDPEASLATTGGKYKRTLMLPGEGVYGISLVVKSKAGIGKSAPRPGDVPEMLIEVDTLPPEAQLLTLMPDVQRRDSLVLTWNAKDRNLGATPITLEWAERPMGPWQPIASSVPNAGRHPWHLPQALPSHVYLKMTVRDTAGNVAVAVTREPQLVDLSEPEGRLLRVTTASKGPR